MSNIVIARFRTEQDAQNARKTFVNAGVNSRNISLLSKDARGEIVDSHIAANTLQGAVSGMIAGGIIGGVIGYLIGANIITFTGVNWFLTAVPLAHAIGFTGTSATTLSGLVLGGIAGGLIGSLMGVSIPDNEIFTYEEPIQTGENLLAIRTREDKTFQIENMSHEMGAYQVQTREDAQQTSSRPFFPNAVVGYKGGKSKKKILK